MNKFKLKLKEFLPELSKIKNTDVPQLELKIDIKDCNDFNSKSLLTEFVLFKVNTKPEHNVYNFECHFDIEVLSKRDLKDDVPPCDIYDERHRQIIDVLYDKYKITTIHSLLTTYSFMITGEIKDI